MATSVPSSPASAGGRPAKRDLKRECRELYACPADRVTEVVVPSATFLAIDGQGDPNTSADYASAVEALFTLAYAIKFAVKRGPRAVDFGVMPLEGLWWADDMAAFSVGAKADWKWTMMIRQPEFVTADIVETLREQIVTKKKASRVADSVADVSLREFTEGRSVQIMHVGPFSAEGPAIARLHEQIAARGARLSGKHHEIYRSDVRRAAPERWRTILRQPMA